MDFEITGSELEQELGKDDGVAYRQDFLQTELQMDMQRFACDVEEMGKIENTIGCLKLPLGIVGPVILEGEFAGAYLVPMVTTESCLVASCQRGAKLTAERGIEIEVVDLGITRAAVLRCASPVGATSVAKWLNDSFEPIKELAEATSEHLELIAVEALADGDFVHLKLTAKTGEAMGMNMITIAMKKVLDEFATTGSPLAVELVAESGNYCSDKKPSALVAVKGRGKRVMAKSGLAGWQLKSLGVTAEDLLQIQAGKFESGAKVAQALGSNAHHANMVAAFYAAMGQDIAHTVEGSLGSTVITKSGDGVEIAVKLPAVLVGTVGGGTALPQVQELMKLMAIKPGVKDSARKMAALLGGLVLCGETSLLVALAKGELASSHARNR